jgi:hypothetical protein
VTFNFLDQIPVPNLEMPRFIAHCALRLLAQSSGYKPLWAEQLGGIWRESKPLHSWPVLNDEAQRGEVRAMIDAVIAEAYGLNREQFERILLSFNHRSYPDAPSLCLAKFDELKTIGMEAFTRKHDPYWDVPLNEALPEPVIQIPFPVVEAAAQGTLGLSGPDAGPKPIGGSQFASEANGGQTCQAEYQNARQKLIERGALTSADLQGLGLTASQARLLLKQLVEDGLAVVEGHGRATRYVAQSSSGRLDADTDEPDAGA